MTNASFAPYPLHLSLLFTSRLLSLDVSGYVLDVDVDFPYLHPYHFFNG